MRARAQQANEPHLFGHDQQRMLHAALKILRMHGCPWRFKGSSTLSTC